MKKTLSVLLSLLMVVSCMTCLFTMPASAVEATSTETVENLPENLLFVVEGTELTLKEGKVIEAGEYYQLDVTYTAESTDKLYPSFANGEDAVSNVEMVGIRYQAATPGYIETVYNYATVVDAANAADSVVGTEYNYTYIISADAAFTSINFGANVTKANLFALKGTDWDNYVWNWSRENYRVVRFMVQEGDNVFQRMHGYRVVGDTSVTDVQNGVPALYVTAKVGGDYYDLYLRGGYDYAYDINTRVPTGAQNPYVRYTGVQYGIMETKLENLIWVDEYKEFKEKHGFESDTDDDFYDRAADWYDEATGQMYFNESANGYMYFYNQANSATTSRRPTAGEDERDWSGDSTMTNLGTKFFTRALLTFSNNTTYMDWFQNWSKDKVKANFPNFNTSNTLSWVNEWAIYSTTSNFGYGLPGYFVGGNAGNSNAVIPEGLWNNWYNYYAIYPTSLVTGQETVEDAIKAAAATGSAYGTSNLRYSYDASTGEFVQNTASNNIIIPATDNAYVALSMGNMYPGYTYDFEPMAFGAITETLDVPYVKGMDSNGALKDIHANDNSTQINFVNTDIANDTATLEFEYDTTREAYGNFVGWYKGDDLVTTNTTLTTTLSTYNPDDYTAVVEYENLLGEVGGFENEAHNTDLSLGNKTVTVYADDGVQLKNYSVHDGTPTGNKWGFYKADSATYKLSSGYSYSNANPYLTENGSFVNAGQTAKVYANRMDGGLSGDTVNYVYPHSGSNMVRFTSASAGAVKAIEGLTPGKSYYVSFYATTVANSTEAVEFAHVGNNVVDISNALQTNTRGTKVYTTVRNSGKYTKTAAGTEGGKAIYTADWKKVTLYFTAENATEYLHLYFVNSHVYVDDFVCKELNDVNSVSEWNFEDGDVAPFGFTTSDMNNVSNLAAVPSVEDAAGQNYDALGNKYFKLTASNHRWNNRANFNFYYDGTSKYTVSFDMKVFEYADYSAGNDMKLEMYLAKLDDGYSTTTYNTETALAPYTGLELTRYWQDGLAYEKVVNANPLGQYMYHTQANTTGGSDLTFGENNGGAIWSEWQHFEIEIDPESTDYVGAAEFTINLTGLGFEIGLDNVKVNKYSLADIEAANAATEGTYAFNIRAAGEGVEQGLRFKSTIDLDILDACGEGSKVVEYGTLVMDAAMLNNYKLTRAVAMDKAKAGVAYVGVAYNRANGTNVQYALDDETNVLTYTGVITGIPTAKFGSAWAVRGYVIIEDANGNQTVVYDDIYTISLITAATYIVNEGNSSDDIAAAQTILDAYYN